MIEHHNFRWLITGGCGFIGANLASFLIAKGVAPRQITIFDNLSHSHASIPNQLSALGINVVLGDILDGAALSRVIENCDVIVHLAASTSVDVSVANPQFDFDHNVIGTFNVLETARKLGGKRIVFASSSAALGNAEPPIHENQAARPISPYGASKLAGEAYCSAYAHSFGLATACLRFGNVYGPGALGSLAVVPNFITRALDGKTLQINGDGLATRDYVYVNDLCDAIMRAGVAIIPAGSIYQIASNSETTVSELLTIIVSKVQEKTGFAADHVFGDERKGDIKRSFSDISLANKELGWQPMTSLVDGLAETIDWFLKQRA